MDTVSTGGMETTTDAGPRIARPGWPEILVGIAAMALVGFGLPSATRGLIDLASPVGDATLACLSGVAGLAGFGAAAALRHRSWQVFGVRRTSARGCGSASPAVSWRCSPRVCSPRSSSC